MLALLFDHYGPYHRARLKGAMSELECQGVEFYSSSHDYAWKESDPDGLPIITIGEEAIRTQSRFPEFAKKLTDALASIRPSVVAVPGWSSKPALTALRWCLDHQVPAIVMSESAIGDFKRRRLTEWIKARIIRQFSAALVGGSRHQAYLQQLGMRSEDIHLGYDAVDNHYFEERSAHLRKGLPSVFLASARFIEKKNLIRLLQAYAQYRATTAESIKPWPLVLLGDGPMRPEILSSITSLNLTDCVTLPGFKQYAEIPSYYANAGAFIHASTTEQWGLVVNEALASSLPVLVSKACGCAPELVREGVNGYTFDPFDVKAMSDVMLRITKLPEHDLFRMGQASLEVVGQWGPSRFGKGLSSTSQSALSRKPHDLTVLDRCLLNILLRQ
jgi:glycosyltransferase involved in cell wall biosynthesis